MSSFSGPCCSTPTEWFSGEVFERCLCSIQWKWFVVGAICINRNWMRTRSDSKFLSHDPWFHRNYLRIRKPLCYLLRTKSECDIHLNVSHYCLTLTSGKWRIIITSRMKSAACHLTPVVYGFVFLRLYRKQKLFFSSLWFQKAKKKLLLFVVVDFNVFIYLIFLL